MSVQPTVKDVVEAIESFDEVQRAELMTVLPAVLRVSPDDIAWLRVAESSFSFWNNDDDAIYDSL